MAELQAVGAVSSVLRQVLSDGLGGVHVGLRPPDLMGDSGVNAGLNLYLYQVERSGRWHNLPYPTSGRPNESPPPLALILRYLLTAFGEDDLATQDALESALSLMTDEAILKSAQVRAIAPGSTLAKQSEPIRLTLVNIESRDLFHLWSTFQAPYRTSVLFEVEVVLVPSRRAVDSPVPVIQRGRSADGPTADASLEPPFPTINSVEPAEGPILGERLTLRGSRLGGIATLRLTPRPQPDSDFPELFLDVAVADRAADAVSVLLVPASGPWRVGMYHAVGLTPEVGSGLPNFEQESNPVNVELTPRIVSVAVNGNPAVPDPGPGPGPLPAAAPTIPAVAQGPARQLTFELTVEPAIGDLQQVLLLLNNRQFPRDPAAPGAPVTALEFTAASIDPGTYWVRVRIDGVDSRLVDRTQTRPALRAFRVEVT
jgi:Pvc16 N-terminal domain